MRKELPLVLIALISSVLLGCGPNNSKTACETTDSDSVAASVDSSKTIEDQNADKSVMVNGHMFVDLGLPSGLLWAETNIGAKSPTDAGIYFAWGETEMKQKKSYTWDSYKFGNAEKGKSTKYNPEKDDIWSLKSEDDAAYVNWGHSCRMPDIDELEELGDEKNCLITLTNIVNPSGGETKVWKVTSLRNGNFIYFPFGGYYDETGYCPNSDDGLDAHVWSRTIHFSGIGALGYTISGQQGYRFEDNCRYYGMQIRPVAKQ